MVTRIGTIRTSRPAWAEAQLDELEPEGRRCVLMAHRAQERGDLKTAAQWWTLHQGYYADWQALIKKYPK